MNRNTLALALIFGMLGTSANASEEISDAAWRCFARGEQDLVGWHLIPGSVEPNEGGARTSAVETCKDDPRHLEKCQVESCEPR